MLEKERKFVPLPIGNISENELRVTLISLLYIFFQKKKKNYSKIIFKFVVLIILILLFSYLNFLHGSCFCQAFFFFFEKTKKVRKIN